MEYSFTRYLSAKKSVDDRALNCPVWHALAGSLPPASPERPLRLLETGCGTGAMLERMLSRGLLTYASYTGFDISAENISEARRRLPLWAAENGWQISSTTWLPDRHAFEICLERPGSWVTARFEAASLSEFAARPGSAQGWDLLVAHAFLDLLPLPAALPQLLDLLAPGGLFYFTINFDGATLFEPCIDPAFDQQVERRYHLTMDRRLVDGKPSGDSRTGRHLFHLLPQFGASILAAGASDWVVFPGAQGYPEDEAYFLHYILHTIEGALSQDPELDPNRFAAWIAARHAQVERGELVYIAHQIDLLGLRSGPIPPITSRSS